MKKTSRTPFAIAVGATLLPLAVSAATDVNPFALSDLSAGYMQTAEAAKDGADKMKDGACGEGKCGAAMGKKEPTAADKKLVESKCAGNKPAAPTDANKAPAK